MIVEERSTGVRRTGERRTGEGRRVAVVQLASHEGRVPQRRSGRGLGIHRNGRCWLRLGGRRLEAGSCSCFGSACRAWIRRGRLLGLGDG